MARRASAQSDEMISGINVTPLVDVTLVLLIIMMVTAKIVISQGITMEIPKTPTTQAGAVMEVLSIKITEQQKIVLNGEELPNVQALVARARDAKSKDPDVKAIINGETKAKHGLVIRVLDILKRNGVDKIAFTKVKEQPAK